MTTSLFDGFAVASQADWQAQLEKDLKGKSISSPFHLTEIEGLPQLPLLQQSEGGSEYPELKAFDAWLAEQLPTTRSLIGCEGSLNASNLASLLAYEIGGLVNDTDGLTKALLQQLDPRQHVLYVADPQRTEGTIDALKEAFPSWQALKLWFLIDPWTAPLVGLDTSKHWQLLKANASTWLVNKGTKWAGINAAAWGHAGANMTTQLSYALKAAEAWIKHAPEVGATPQEAWDRLVVSIAFDADLFVNLAAVRALKYLLHGLATHHGLKPTMPTVVASYGKHQHMPWDAETEMIRLAAFTLGAHLASVDGVVLQLPEADVDTNPISRAMVNLPHLLQNEGRIAGASTAAGSLYIDAITMALVEQAWKGFTALAGKDLDAVLQDGTMQARTEASRIKRHEAITTSQVKWIGGNIYAQQALTVKPYEPLPVTEGLIGLEPLKYYQF